jgi:hypothetical protein
VNASAGVSAWIRRQRVGQSRNLALPNSPRVLANGAGAQLRAAHAARCHSGGRPTSPWPNRPPAGPEPCKPRCGGASAAAPCWAALRPLGGLEPPAPRRGLSRRRRRQDLGRSMTSSTPPALAGPEPCPGECPRAQPMSAVPGSEPGRATEAVTTSPSVSCARERRRGRSESALLWLVADRGRRTLRPRRPRTHARRCR